MHTPLNASATTAGNLLSSYVFEVPQYQREYAWDKDEVAEFWSDLKKNLNKDSYFLGLVILTGEGARKQVVDGQQRILTLSLLAAALHRAAISSNRKALADSLRSDFLRSIDYETDEIRPRVVLSDSADNKTLQSLLKSNPEPTPTKGGATSDSALMRAAYDYLSRKLSDDLAEDTFKRLGVWADFLTNKLYFAVFVHPDTASAYRVFEVINTRGKELTTADLLKSYVISETSKNYREQRYREWQRIAKQFSANGSSSFVQYIRHVVTVHAGHILPKDLYDYLAPKSITGAKRAPSADELMAMLERNLSLYLQMVDPTREGPADSEQLKIFASLNELSVISVRPLLLAISATQDPLEGMRYVLRMVVRRIVAGSLGTGNVERMFGEAARRITEAGRWQVIEQELRDLNPEQSEFKEQIGRRSYNKATLAFLRRSLIFRTQTPEPAGVLHFIRPPGADAWDGTDDDSRAWGTIGNTVLANLPRRPKTASTWQGFKESILPHAVADEWVGELERFDEWTPQTAADLSAELAEVAGHVWY